MLTAINARNPKKKKTLRHLASRNLQDSFARRNSAVIKGPRKVIAS
jgi:hypothetical protein